MRSEKVIELGEQSHTNGLFTPIFKQGEENNVRIIKKTRLST